MKIQTSIYRKRYYEKPDKKETALMQSKKYNRLKIANIELSELLSLIEHGCTFRPTATRGNSDTDFVSGQLIGIDIDNEQKVNGKKSPLPPDKQLTLESAIALAKEKGLYPCFAYRTFSAKPLHDKYRIVFCLNRAVTDPHQWRHIYKKTAAVFGDFPDPACKNPSRVFYGSNQKASYADLDARIDTEAMLTDYVPPAERKAPKKANTGHQKDVNTGGIATDIVTAIQAHDFDFIRKATGREKPICFNNRAEMFDFIYKKISLADLLNVTEGEAFSCIVPDHEDSDPSASVFRAADTGIWLYKCQSAENCPTQGRPLTIKMLIEHVGDFRSEAASIEFLRKAFNLQVFENAYVRQQRENIDQIIQSVTGTDDLSFCAICPTADKNIRFCKTLYISILCYARDHIQPDAEGEGGLIFFMPLKNFVKNTEGLKSVDKVCKYTKLLIYHGLLEIVPFDELPKETQKKLRAGQNNGYNVCQHYRVPSWVHPHLLKIESQAKKWRAAGYRVNGISYENFFRSEGPKVANMLYPQRKHKKLSAEADKRHDLLVNILLDMIQEQGFASEKAINRKLTEVLAGRGYAYSRYYSEAQVKRSITEAIYTYGLTKGRCNKDLKAKFGIPGNGYPTIIYME